MPALTQGRLDWDLPHTQNVVRYVKEITSKYDYAKVEAAMLVITAYLHDFGYLFFKDELKPGPTRGRAKAEHAKKSAEKWNEISTNNVFDFLSVAQKNRIHHLIEVHDSLSDLIDQDELLFMEADTLGALATQSNIDRSSLLYRNYLQHTRDARVGRFISQYSKQEAQKLLKKLEQ